MHIREPKAASLQACHFSAEAAHPSDQDDPTELRRIEGSRLWTPTYPAPARRSCTSATASPGEYETALSSPAGSPQESDRALPEPRLHNFNVGVGEKAGSGRSSSHDDSAMAGPDARGTHIHVHPTYGALFTQTADGIGFDNHSFDQPRMSVESTPNGTLQEAADQERLSQSKHSSTPGKWSQAEHWLGRAGEKPKETVLRRSRELSKQGKCGRSWLPESLHALT